MGLGLYGISVKRVAVINMDITLETFGKLEAIMNKLPKEDQPKFCEALGSLCAEVDLHVRNKVFEELRQQWSDVLNTMLLISPRKRNDKAGLAK